MDQSFLPVAGLIFSFMVLHSEGRISHAILDVFEKEPLPTDSELWTRPDITLTPHISPGLVDMDQVLLASLVFIAM